MENFNENISKIFGNKIESGQMIVTNKQLFEDEKPHTLTFDFYDGFGFCENYDNKRYYIYYPLISFFNNRKEVVKEVIDNATQNSKEEEKLTPFNIALTFGEICCLDGKSEYDLLKERENEENEIEIS